MGRGLNSAAGASGFRALGPVCTGNDRSRLDARLVRDTSVDGKAALHTGYVGRSGCRLSLFRFTRPDARQEFDLSSEGGLLHASWSGGAEGFLLVARGMDEARFALLAGSLKLASEGERQGGGLIASLGVMRQPCVG
jgi:hypothetical protein